MIKGVKIRKLGGSKVLEFTKIEVSPFKELKEWLDEKKKLPAYVEGRGESIIIHLPRVSNSVIEVKSEGELTTIWKVEGDYPRYYLTIPSSLSSRLEGEDAVVDVDGWSLIISPGIVISKREL